MSIIKKIIIGAVVAGMFSCSPEELPPPDNGNDPVFNFSASMDGQEKTFTAGEDDYYMFTDFSIDQQNIYTFEGRFAKLQGSCINNCQESITIRIRDMQIATSAGVNIESALQPGVYNYDDGVGGEMVVDTTHMVNFVNKSVTSNPASTSYLWEFGANNISTETTPPPQNISALASEVSLITTVEAAGSVCSNILTRTIATGTLPGFLTEIQVDIAPVGPITLTAFPQDSISPYSYQWNTGQATSTIVVNSMQPDTYCVTVGNNNGNSSSNCVNFVFTGGGMNPLYCSSAFEFETTAEIDTISIGNLLRLSLVEVVYSNPDGIVYSSINAEQSPNNQFEILGIDNFENNENGEKTKKVTISINCQLTDANGNSITLENGSGVIGVAYP